jgi:hypothetical protein
MPRDLTGSYALPSGNPIAFKEKSSSAKYNAALTDIAAALTGSLPRNGSAPMNGPLDMGGNSITNVVNATLTGLLTLALGTAAAPSLAFTGAPSTGIYAPAAGQFGITVGGAAALTINANRNVVLPAPVSGDALQIAQIGSGSALRIVGRAGDNVSGIAFYDSTNTTRLGGIGRGVGEMTFDAGGSVQLAINAATNVRIAQNGAGSPPLTVQAVANNFGIDLTGSAGQATRLRIASNGVAAGASSFDIGQGWLSATDGIGWLYSRSAALILAAGTASARVTVPNNVGFAVAVSGDVGQNPPNNDTGQIFTVNNEATTGGEKRLLAFGQIGTDAFVRAVLSGAGVAPGLRFFTNSAERMRIVGTSGQIQVSAQYTPTAQVFGSANLAIAASSAYAELTDGAKSLLMGVDAGDPFIGTYSAHGLAFRTGNSARAVITAAGVFNYSADLVTAELGWRGLPQHAPSGSPTLTAAERGKHVSITTAGATVTIPANVYGPGDAVSIVNWTGGNITIAQGAGTNLFLAGTGATGNRTLGTRGVATFICVTPNNFAISGAGIA